MVAQLDTMLIIQLECAFLNAIILFLYIKTIFLDNVLISVHMELLGTIPIWILNLVYKIVLLIGIKTIQLGHVFKDVRSSPPITLILLFKNAYLNVEFKWMNMLTIQIDNVLLNAQLHSLLIIIRVGAYPIA